MRKETDTKRLMCPYSKTKTQNLKLIIVHLPQTRHRTQERDAGMSRGSCDNAGDEASRRGWPI